MDQTPNPDKGFNWSQIFKRSLSDFSLWSLIFSNFVAIFFTFKEHWSLHTLMWVYWFQSVTIGIFQVVRILQLKGFSTDGFEIDGKSVLPTKKTKIQSAFIFVIHYSLFHLVYLLFLTGEDADLHYGGILNGADIKYVVITALVFFANHLFSYIFNKPRDTEKQNIGHLMFYPYIRILPMHLIILFGSLLRVVALPFFLLLKTIADVLMHIIEHNVLRKGEA